MSLISYMRGAVGMIMNSRRHFLNLLLWRVWRHKRHSIFLSPMFLLTGYKNLNYFPEETYTRRPAKHNTTAMGHKLEVTSALTAPVTEGRKEERRSTRNVTVWITMGECILLGKVCPEVAA